jgi:hypothetical protein
MRSEGIAKFTALSAGNLQSRNANHLALHVDDGTAT